MELPGVSQPTRPLPWTGEGRKPPDAAEGGPDSRLPSHINATTSSNVASKYRTSSYEDAVRRAHSRWFVEQERRHRERRGEVDPRRMRRVVARWRDRFGDDEAERMLEVLAALAEVRR